MSESTSQINAQAFDMFCSIGGLTYGLQEAGIKVKAGLDVDGSCRYAYETNCQATFLKADIRDISYSDISEHFDNAEYRILVGCAPCQPFSSLPSKKKPESESDWILIVEFLRIILEGRPEIVLMENVPQLISQPVYEAFKQALAAAGYHVSNGILPCVQFRVPQLRRRLVLLASLLDEIDLPKPDPMPPRTVRQVIKTLPPLEQGQSSAIDPLHICSRLNPINLKRIQASKPGRSWRDWPADLLPDCYKKASGHSYGSVYGRMQWDAPAPTLTTQFYRYGTGRFGHPEQDRALSLREGALLQTFPEHYQFVEPGKRVSFSKIGRHIGNAVPPTLAAAIGRAINGHLEKEAGKHATTRWSETL